MKYQFNFRNQREMNSFCFRADKYVVQLLRVQVVSILLRFSLGRQSTSCKLKAPAYKTVFVLQTLVESLHAAYMYSWSHLAVWCILYQSRIIIHGLLFHHFQHSSGKAWFNIECQNVSSGHYFGYSLRIYKREIL